MKHISIVLHIGICCFISIHIAFAWGGTTHKFINKNAVTHVPSSMQKFIDQQTFLETHSTDPDTRKGADTAEGPKHFLDIDYYPNYQHLTHSLDSLLAQYGYNIVVKDNGILPWATVWAHDSLTAQLKRGDWTTAYQTAADLGHYVADGHQPLHVAMNYDGQLSMPSQKGIHYRYESTMMGKYLGEILVAKDSVRYIENPTEFIFSYLLTAHFLLDSILLGDKYAAPPNGSSGGTLPADYYQKLWEKTQRLTKFELQLSTIDLASLWYTAWVNAGLLAKPTKVNKTKTMLPKQFQLEQNYPNPFNPSTIINYQLSLNSVVTLKVYDVLGKEVATLVHGNQQAGLYVYQFSISRYQLNSGVYYYRLQANEEMITKKLVLLK